MRLLKPDDQSCACLQATILMALLQPAPEVSRAAPFAYYAIMFARKRLHSFLFLVVDILHNADWPEDPGTTEGLS